MSKRQIVDAHHHLWDLGACHYPWLMAKGVERFFGDPTPIQKDYLVADLRDDARDFELEASVHIQVGVAPGDEVNETDWLQRTADSEGLPSAIVAYCDLEKPEAPEVIASHMRYPGVRGIRQIIGRSDAEDAQTGSGQLISDPIWQDNLEMLGELGLSFDLQLTPGQIEGVAEVLDRTPATQVALCHSGSPWDQSTEGIASWRAGLRLLAALPNVYCKISGLGMFNHNWEVDDIRPIVESCIEIFGADRAMFGSNFPVDKLHADYAKVWHAYEAISAGLSESEQQQLFGDTARAFYGID